MMRPKLKLPLMQVEKVKCPLHPLLHTLLSLDWDYFHLWQRICATRFHHVRDRKAAVAVAVVVAVVGFQAREQLAL